MKIVQKPAFEVVSVERILSLIMPENDCFQMPQNALKVPFGHSVFWLVSLLYIILYRLLFSLFFVVFSSLYGPQPFLWGASFGGVRCCSACLHYGLQYVFYPFMCHLDCSGYLHFEASVKALEGV